VRTASPPVIDIRGLNIAFSTDDGKASVVRDVSFAIPRGGTIGLVGESGCGKSMTGLALLGLVPPPGRIESGVILYHGKDGEKGSASGSVDIAALPPKGERIRALRGSEIAMVFQEPMSSLTPVYTIGQQISEIIRTHENVTRKEAHLRSIEMLTKVGIPAPETRVNDYPHQLSGGMRQRAVIAMALACNPTLLIADEPTTALDVTVQAQILDLMRDLQAELGMAILMISHDLGVIADMAEEIVVMYAGRVVEHGSAEQIFYEPLHPYTRGLLRSAPVLGSRNPALSSTARLYSIPGTVPNPLAMPRGCPLRPRCPERFAACLGLPDLKPIEPTHLVRCWARERDAGLPLPTEAAQEAHLG
jgi:oligopeptide/dipeptide ABC transporter ATP-binding protein